MLYIIRTSKRRERGEGRREGRGGEGRGGEGRGGEGRGGEGRGGEGRGGEAEIVINFVPR